jgi:hypothetical protein
MKRSPLSFQRKASRLLSPDQAKPLGDVPQSAGVEKTRSSDIGRTGAAAIGNVRSKKKVVKTDKNL